MGCWTRLDGRFLCRFRYVGHLRTGGMAYKGHDSYDSGRDSTMALNVAPLLLDKTRIQGMAHNAGHYGATVFPITKCCAS